MIMVGFIYFLKEFVGCYVLHNGVRETSNINSLYNDCNSTLKFIDNIVSLYSNLYPQYADFFQDYIPIKIADAFIRDRICFKVNYVATVFLHCQNIMHC